MAAYAAASATTHCGSRALHARNAPLTHPIATAPNIAPVTSWNSCRSSRHAVRKNPCLGCGRACCGAIVIALTPQF